MALPVQHWLSPFAFEKRPLLINLIYQIKDLDPSSSDHHQETTLGPKLRDLDGRILNERVVIIPNKFRIRTAEGTVLHLAAVCDLPIAAHMLTEKGAEVNVRDSMRHTPLEVALQHGSRGVAEVLIKKGAHVNAGFGLKPLMRASRHGFVDIIDLLLERNADPMVTTRSAQWSALHYACWYGQKAAAERLLAKDDSNLNNKDRDGLVPLGLAVKRGHEEVVKALLRDREAEANPAAEPGDATVPNGSQSDTSGPSGKKHPTKVQLEATDEDGRTMLVVAAQSGFTGIFEALVKAGANTEVTYGKSETILMHICRYGHLDVAKKLFDLRDNISVDAVDQDQETALHKASSGGHVQLVKFLVDKEANVNVEDSQTWTPLHKACEQGHLEVVQTLLGKRADATARNSGAMNALHIACSASAKGALRKDPRDPGTGSNEIADIQGAVSSGGFGDIITTLLAEGCSPFLEDQNKRTAFHHAFPEDGEPTTLNFLLKGAKQHYFSKPSRNLTTEVDVLLWAIGKRQRHEIVRLILSQQQPSAENSPETVPPGSQEWNVIEWAAFRGYPWVLFPLLAEAVKSATPKTLQRALSIAEDALKKQRRRGVDGDTTSDGEVKANISPIEVNRQTVRDLLLYPPFTSFSTQGIKLQSPTRPQDLQKLLQAWTASIIHFRVPKAGTSSFLRRDRFVWDVIYGEGPGKVISDERMKLSQLLEQLKKTSKAGEALAVRSGYLDRDDRGASFGWVHLPATNMAWMNHLFQKIMYEGLSEEINEKRAESVQNAADTGNKASSDGLTEQREIEFQEMSYFLNNSWSQIPDESSRFRIMRPCFVQSSKQTPVPKSPTSRSETTKEEDEQEEKPQTMNKDPEPAPPQSEQGNREGALPPSTEGGRARAQSPDTLSKEEAKRAEIQAIYLPYFVFSEYHKEEDSMTNEEKSRVTIKIATRQDQTTTKDDKENDDTELNPGDEARSEGHHEKVESSKNEHQQVDVPETSRKKGKLVIEDTLQQEQTANKDGNESDDTELDSEDEVRFEGHHEELDGSKNEHQQVDVLETPIQETLQHRWNILQDNAKKHDDMAKAYPDDVVHRCSTLDESYYHFEIGNDEAENDRQYRNRTQIVTKNARKSRINKKQESNAGENGTEISSSGNQTETGDGKGANGVKSRDNVSRIGMAPTEITSIGLESQTDKTRLDNQLARNSGSHGVDKISDEDLHWPVLRVNQLWVWVIDRKWLITSTTDPLDDAERPLITGFLDHLQKQAAAGQMHSQPQTTFEISRALVDYCIGAYDRIPDGLNPEGGHRRSMRQIFSQSINDIATKETELYKEFRKQKNTGRSGQSGIWLTGSSQEANQKIEDNIWRAIDLSHELRDVKDELNILASLAKYQSAVQKDQTDHRPLQADNSALDVVKDIHEMEKMADRLQSSIDTTLSLEQNEISIAEARETVKQGRILMVFTLITIVFLPLSFLATFFAIDFSSFRQTPYWVHFIIFLGSSGFSVCFFFAAVKWDHLRSKLQKLVDKSPESPDAADHGISVGGIRAKNGEVVGNDINQPKKTRGIRFRTVRHHPDKDVERGE